MSLFLPLLLVAQKLARLYRHPDPYPGPLVEAYVLAYTYTHTHTYTNTHEYIQNIIFIEIIRYTIFKIHFKESKVTSLLHLPTDDTKYVILTIIILNIVKKYIPYKIL